MEFSELITLRQSDRKYCDAPVEKEKILRCIEAARMAPSACNSQPWKFVIVDDPDLKTELAESAASIIMNKFTYQAPIMVAVVLEKMNLTSTMGSVIKDKEYSLMDVGMAVNQFCLQAAEQGLGTCILGWFNEPKVKKILKVPDKKRVPLLISLGYPAGKTRKKSRKSAEEMSSWNEY